MADGDQKERDLVNWFRDQGWGAMRAPSSGSGTDEEMPDVIASRPGKPWLFIEAKYRASEKQCYESPEKASGLALSAARWGARPIWFVRYSTRLQGVQKASWRVAEYTVPPTTDSGRVKLHHSIAKDWATAEEIFG